MTHFFVVSENEMSLLSSGQKTFDVLKFNRSVSLGDTIIYQLEEILPSEDPENPRAVNALLPQEFSVKIDYLFEDSEGALKKGFNAVSFKNKEV